MIQFIKTLRSGGAAKKKQADAKKAAGWKAAEKRQKKSKPPLDDRFYIEKETGGGDESNRGAKEGKVSCSRQRSWVAQDFHSWEKRSRLGSWSPNIFLRIPNLHNIYQKQENLHSFSSNTNFYLRRKVARDRFCKSTVTYIESCSTKSWAKKEVAKDFS